MMLRLPLNLSVCPPAPFFFFAKLTPLIDDDNLFEFSDTSGNVPKTQDEDALLVGMSRNVASSMSIDFPPFYIPALDKMIFRGL